MPPLMRRKRSRTCLRTLSLSRLSSPLPHLQCRRLSPPLRPSMSRLHTLLPPPLPPSLLPFSFPPHSPPPPRSLLYLTSPFLLILLSFLLLLPHLPPSSLPLLHHCSSLLLSPSPPFRYSLHPPSSPLTRSECWRRPESCHRQMAVPA